jgi:hypothetical protein
MVADKNKDNSKDNNNNSINEDNKSLPKRLIPLMKKATALWLIDNTSLTFNQIADFCDIHILEIEGMADGDVSNNITPHNPIDSGQLTRYIIEECENDPNKSLCLSDTIADHIEINKKGRKNNTYVPLAKREEKPNAIMYLLKYYPNITDKQIRVLVNTTTPVINSIRNRTHWNIRDIRPKDPVMLGLCSQTQFNEIVGEVGEL